MQEYLFEMDIPVEVPPTPETFEFELWDESRYRQVLKRICTEEDAQKSNNHFINSFCPHLQFRRVSESKTKVYRIKRG